MSSYHGWTHRPKVEGGTDPIGLGISVHYAELLGSSNTVTTATSFNVNQPYPWTSYVSSDVDEVYLAEFTDDNTDLGIEIKQFGIYLIQWTVRIRESNATNVIPPHIRLPLSITTGTEFSTSSFSITPGPIPNWHSVAPFVLTGSSAAGSVYLGGAYTLVQGSSGVPKRVCPLITSVGGTDDWIHDLGQFMVVRLSDYPRTQPA